MELTISIPAWLLWTVGIIAGIVILVCAIVGFFIIVSIFKGDWRIF